MLEEIPSLTPAERTLLHRFRVEQSPDLAVAARVMRGVSARLSKVEVEAPIERPWWLWLRAGGLSVAIAASALLVLGGTTRVMSRLSTPAPSEAIDVSVPGPSHETAAPAATTVPAVPLINAVSPPGDSAELPAVPATDRSDSTPVISSDTVGRRSPARVAPRGTSPRDASPKPVDSAAEIALFQSIQVERDPKQRLASIQQYRRDYARGQFVQEVAVHEIKALCQLGRTTEASERGVAFGRAFGDSAYSAIARRGCAEAKP